MAFEFDLDAPLGGGYNGKVYKARDTNLDRYVAVKFFESTEDKAVKQIKRHIQPLLTIDHPNVVKILQLDEQVPPGLDKKEHCVVMEYLDGSTLKSYLKSGSISREVAAALVNQLIDGLAAFHDKGVYHGDLHGGNIMIVDGSVKIIDPYSQVFSTALRTTEEDDLLEYDLRCLSNIICQMLDAVGEPGLAPRYSYLFGSGMKSCSGVRAGFELVMKSDASVGTTKFQIYMDQTAKLSPAEMQATVRRVCDTQSAALSVWAEANKGIVINPETVNDVLGDVWSSNTNAWAMLLSFTSAGGNFTKQYKIIKKLAFADFSEYSGRSVFVDIPISLAYAAIRICGALAMIAGSEAQLLGLIGQKYRFKQMPPSDMFGHDDLKGWPGGVGGDCFLAWQFVLSLYRGDQDLADAFGTEIDYQAALLAFSVTVGYGKFLARPAEYQKESFRPPLDMPPIPFGMFGKQRDEVFHECLDIIEDFPNIGHVLANISSGNGDVDGDWGEYLQAYLYFINSGRQRWHWGVPELMKLNPFS